MDLTVIIPTHNPDRERLRRTLLGLSAQRLALDRWETIVVDNASSRFPDRFFFEECAPVHCSIVAEPALGLTAARRRGLAAARGEVCVLVDDDNVLAPDYLENVLRLFGAHSKIGAMGGRSLPEFEQPPPAWSHEFFGLLALRDLGPAPLISEDLRSATSARNEYPLCAPIGAGMALRRVAIEGWCTGAIAGSLSDRRGTDLTSAGDNDIVFAVLRAGWKVAYFPELSLTHLIPATRLEPGYLARLNRGIAQSWMRVLTLHEANPWPPLSPFDAQLRQWKAWFTHQPWRSHARAVRWAGACGHFAGRIRSP